MCLVKLTERIPCPKYLANKTSTIATPPIRKETIFVRTVAFFSERFGLKGRIKSSRIIAARAFRVELIVLKTRIYLASAEEPSVKDNN